MKNIFYFEMKLNIEVFLLLNLSFVILRSLPLINHYVCKYNYFHYKQKQSKSINSLVFQRSRCSLLCEYTIFDGSMTSPYARIKCYYSNQTYNIKFVCISVMKPIDNFQINLKIWFTIEMQQTNPIRHSTDQISI